MEHRERNGVVAKRTVDGLTVVTLAGELDIATAQALRRELVPSSSATMPDLVLDLRQVRFMDCSVIGVMIRVYRQVVTAGGCLRLVGSAEGPLRLLGLCQLEGVFCVHDSLAAATQADCDRHSRKRECPEEQRAGSPVAP